MKNLIEKLNKEKKLSKEEWIFLLNHQNDDLEQYAAKLAGDLYKKVYQNKVYVRALIEFTNYCKNDCFYCGIRKGNKKTARYRLSTEAILDCCERSYEAGYRTFVLQGGEDPYFTDERMIQIIASIHKLYPDCAITLSIGEKSYESYKAYYDAGASRFLLRHETYSPSHYAKLHPASLSAENRQQCLLNLKEIGYQVGSGFMVGSPYQTNENLAEDMLFIKALNPQMLGVGPYITHPDTPFFNMPSGTLHQTLFILSLLRIMIPEILLPSTTALGTLGEDGRILGIKAGANVVMQNITPKEARVNYTLYKNKERAGDIDIRLDSPFFKALKKEGYYAVTDIGDSLNT